MDKLNKLGGGIKAVGVVVMVLALTSALVLLAAEKAPVVEAESGFLGVSVQRLADGEREKLGVKHGVLVAAVEQESAAAKAGIIKGDVILSVKDEKIRDAQTLAEVVRELAPGSAAKIGLWRGNQAIDVKVVLGKLERPKRMQWKVGPMTKVLRSGAYLGIQLLELDKDLSSYFSVKAGEGILVTRVEKETPAAKAGFKSGDVIVQMADQAIRTSGDIHEALAALKKGDTIAITVVRQGKRETLKAEPDFGHRERVMRFFDGGKDMEIRHLELPELELDVRVPELPEPPDAEEIELHIHKKLEHAHQQLDHAHEKLDQVKVKIEKQLKTIAEDFWI